jgi:hypothetical protein
MKFNHVHQIFSTNLTNTHKCLEKILFTRRTESFFCLNFFLIQFSAKKVVFLIICGCWSNWWKKFGVHCWTSCKIRTPTDKYRGNESKIRLTSKNLPFYTPILTFQINDQKTREFRQPSDIPQGHFFGLNWVKPSHLKFAINIFIVRIQKSITRWSRSHQFWGKYVHF